MSFLYKLEIKHLDNDKPTATIIFKHEDNASLIDLLKKILELIDNTKGFKSFR